MLRKLADDARDRGLAPVVVTPANPSLSVLRPNAELRLLTSLRERLELLRQAGPAEIVPHHVHTRRVPPERAGLYARAQGLPADRAFRGRSGLRARTQPRGNDARARRPGEGDWYTIEAAGHFLLDSMPVSSTAVRQGAAERRHRPCAPTAWPAFRARRPRDRGRRARRRTPRLPHSQHRSRPAAGAPRDRRLRTALRVGDRSLPAAASIGSKPTFHDGGPTVVEAFVIASTATCTMSM